MGSHQLTRAEFDAALQAFHLDFPSDWFAVLLIQVEPDVQALLGPEASPSQESLRYVRFWYGMCWRNSLASATSAM